MSFNYGELLDAEIDGVDLETELSSLTSDMKLIVFQWLDCYDVKVPTDDSRDIERDVERRIYDTLRNLIRP